MCIVLMKLVRNNRNSIWIVRMQNVICVCCNQREMGRGGGGIYKIFDSKLSPSSIRSFVQSSIYMNMHIHLVHFLNSIFHINNFCQYPCFQDESKITLLLSLLLEQIHVKTIYIFINCRGEKIFDLNFGGKIVERFTNS